ncbi:glycoside hydrolase superfamily [Polychytrium aggregatum]|uniref:glycoside hydrolase superfamily n=1 Tax=Polychytrium aggregatum TaxID=110093 RepID=UPI0022FF14B3|nr:glycoside hydrolase superfamily [Polychytrium aggregatum]KAI9202556.1 glycoside hydrolase superfamily [Polychytrium aggregatum]
MGYWGNQSGYGEQSLASYCDTGDYDVIYLAFMYIWGQGQAPQVDFYGNPNGAVPSIYQLPQVAADVQHCQSKGVAVMISVGGATGTSYLSSAADATDFANKLWNLYLGGNVNDPSRPLGTTVLDGVDLDIEDNVQQYYDVFATSLRAAGASKGLYYLTGAPQCVMPDAGLNTALQNAGNQFDWVNAQYYNNYCGANAYSSPADIANTQASFSYAAWNALGAQKGFQSGLGLAASSNAANTGYVSPSTVQSIVSAIRANPTTSPNFAGVMFWSCAHAAQNGNFAASMRSILG